MKKYVFCITRNCRVSYLSFVYGRSLWAELNGGENSLHWEANILPLFSIMTLWVRFINKVYTRVCFLTEIIINGVLILNNILFLYWSYLTSLSQLVLLFRLLPQRVGREKRTVKVGAKNSQKNEKNNSQTCKLIEYVKILAFVVRTTKTKIMLHFFLCFFC